MACGPPTARSRHEAPQDHSNGFLQFSNVPEGWHELEAQAQILGGQVERLRSSQSPSSNKSDEGQWQGRALDAEQKLIETEQTYKSKLQQMEDDYQLAVKYVK